MQSLHKRKNVSEDELEEVQSRRDIAQQELAVARARLAIIEERLGRTRVTSPFNGIVVERNHREGEDVSRGDELLKLQQADQLELRLFVPVKHLASLAPGQQVAVFRQKARGNKVAANIRSIVPSADSRSQTVEVRIDLKQDGGLNWIPGELLRAEIGLPAETGQLAVPRDAILIRSSGTFVVVIDDQKMAHRIAVQLGRAKDQWINIRSDSEYLKAGNHVAVRGAERLNQGQQVTIGNS
jgi:RND family efflux transporter MFP subunit